MQAKLIKKSFLFREWEVSGGQRLFRLAYDGMGIGIESILKDGEPLVKVESFYWFAPRFEFEIDGVPFVVTVRVWPWLQIRALRISVSDQVIYSEGTMKVAGYP